MIWRVFDFPRYTLTFYPTPLEKASRLSKELNIELYIKRDDVMTLALGGNKVRKLEFILGDALSKNCNVLITRGALHSNHARLTAAAARKAGLDVYLVLTPPGSRELQGNLLLDKLMDAKIIFVSDPDKADDVMEEIARDLRSKGKRPYVIPGGGASAHGVLGYIVASLEILQQFYNLKKKPKYIVHATGTGATQAGLILGMKLLGIDDIKIMGISVGRKARECKERITKLINITTKLLDIDLKIKPDDIIVFDDYIFGGYGTIVEEIVETIRYVAKIEGLILDPIYTGKAMYGLIDLVNSNYIEKESIVLFIHTGGTPIPFQYSTLIKKYL